MTGHVLVDIEQLCQEVEAMNPNEMIYFNLETGEHFLISSDELYFAENQSDRYDESLVSLASIEHAVEVLYSDHLEMLPIQTEEEEVKLLKKFILSHPQVNLDKRLYKELNTHKGAIRVKQSLHIRGLLNEWYTFRHNHLLQTLETWCSKHHLDYRAN